MAKRIQKENMALAIEYGYDPNAGGGVYDPDAGRWLVEPTQQQQTPEQFLEALASVEPVTPAAQTQKDAMGNTQSDGLAAIQAEFTTQQGTLPVAPPLEPVNVPGAGTLDPSEPFDREKYERCSAQFRGRPGTAS